jgi:YfiH family protein
VSGAPAWLQPRWDAPAGVRSAFTLRGGGASAGAYASLNLGAHVGDDPAAVAANRARVRAALALPSEPVWLEQQHGVRVADLDREPAPAPADAALTREAGRVCAVLVADCLPVLLATRRGDAVAAAHAGWRGLAAGVLEATVAAFGVPGSELVAWLGPAIGPNRFEVGAEVRQAFLEVDAGCGAAFQPNERGRWLCDLPGLARRRLAAAGVTAIARSSACTCSDATRFYSHRREQPTGRMAALVWIGPETAGAGGMLESAPPNPDARSRT